MRIAKAIDYTLHCRGRAGLAQTLLSLELGVGLAALTDRVLLVAGNEALGGAASGCCRITDLFTIPIPWGEASVDDRDGTSLFQDRDRRSLRIRSLRRIALLDAVYVAPWSLREERPHDLRAFVQRRRACFTLGEESAQQADVICLPGRSEVKDDDGESLCPGNIGFYSTFFYLGERESERMRKAVSGIEPLACYRELACKIARSLGRFHAVHVGLGNEAGDVMERLTNCFDRQSRLVILTDDPHGDFLRPVREYFSDPVVLGDSIERYFGRELAALPHSDAAVVALLCQLTAVEAEQFIGTLGSGFTGLIQRWRMQRGEGTRFQFLTPELPYDVPPGAEVRLQANGEMVETGEGPYTWNRVTPELDLHDAREWPEALAIKVR